jgi:hypothetical protein
MSEIVLDQLGDFTPDQLEKLHSSQVRGGQEITAWYVPGGLHEGILPQFRADDHTGHLRVLRREKYGWDYVCPILQPGSHFQEHWFVEPGVELVERAGYERVWAWAWLETMRLEHFEGLPLNVFFFEEPRSTYMAKPGWSEVARERPLTLNYTHQDGYRYQAKCFVWSGMDLVWDPLVPEVLPVPKLERYWFFMREGDAPGRSRAQALQARKIDP